MGLENKDSEEFNQSLVNNVAREIVKEQRLRRIWGIFFKLLLALYVLIFLTIYLNKDVEINRFSERKHTALVDIEGIIATGQNARTNDIVSSLRDAFEDDNTQGVIIRINSPGGSPVQASYINDEIRRLRAKYPHIPVYSVISDICASGGYYIAVASDEIYANKASIVGSIGVVIAGFGFVNAIEKLGIERRLLHAGENKGLLDPFQPLKYDEEKHMQELLDEIHQQFIDVVKRGRGEKLKDDEKLFSGLVWSGEKSVELGLVDGLASAGEVARDIIGAEDIVDFTQRETYLDRFAKNIGAIIYQRFNDSFGLR